MTQKAALEFLGISRSKMTFLRNGKLGPFSIDLLFSLLEKLDRHTDNNRNYAHGQKIGYNIVNQERDEWQEATPNFPTLHYFNAIC